MDFKEIIKRHLDKMAQQDFAFAERYKDEKKSLDKCIQYITSQAKKKAKNNGVWLEDAVVYGWAVHYYQEDDIKVESTKEKVKVGHVGGDMKPTDVEDTFVNVKKTKAIVKDKKENKCVELDLFGGF
jgi:hypothetical protein